MHSEHSIILQERATSVIVPRWPIGLLAMVAAACATVPANGIAAPSPIDLSTSQPGEDDYRRAIASYAHCLSGHQGQELRLFMNTGIADPRVDSALRALAKATPQCSRPKRARKFGPEALALRGALIERAYATEFGPLSPPSSFRDVPAMAYMPSRPGGERTANVMAAGMLAIFDCVVREQPQTVAEVLGHPVASREESLAFSKLGPAFSICLPGNLQFKMRASNVRPYLAEAFYTLTKLKRANLATRPAE